MTRSHVCARLAAGAMGLAGLAASCTDPSVLNPQGGSVEPFDHQLTMTRHVDQPITTATVDAFLAEAGGLLDAVDNDCPDVHCPATFTRTGGLGVFSEGDSVLTSERQLDVVFGVDGDFKIVTFMVGVCGAPSGDDPAVVLGCAATAASVVIVYDAPTDVWAHEWGHVQGLPHRNDCDRNLMHAYELETNAVNATERNAFLTPTPSGAFINLRAIADAPCASCREKSADLPLAERIQAMISHRYLQGIPRDTLTDVPVAERVDALLEAWPAATVVQRANLARLLGLAGDPRACDVLAEWLDSRFGETTTEELAAVSETLLALGRLAARDDAGVATAALLAATEPQTWTARGVTLRATDGENRAATAPLVRIGVLALGISRVEAARARLSDLQAAERTQRGADPWLGAQIDEALARLDGELNRLRPVARPDRLP